MNAGKPEKSKDISDEFDEAKSISQMIREVSSAGDEKPKKDRKTPLVHKPLFEKINSKNIRMEKIHNEKLDELTRQKAEANRRYCFPPRFSPHQDLRRLPVLRPTAV